MAKKHFLIPSKLVNKLPVLRKLIWLLEATVVKFLVALIRMMPPERAYRFANSLFRILQPALPFTATIRKNLRLAFPDRTKEDIAHLTRAVCGNLGMAMVDLVLAERVWTERDKRFEFVMASGVDFTSYRDRPAVLVGGHIGAWQFGAFVAAQYGLDITTVYAPEQNPYLKEFFVQLRSALPMHFVSRDGCMRALSKELKNGHVIALISDTRMDAGEPVEFFASTVWANTSAARLAIRHRCDMVPVNIERLQDAKFRITAYPPIKPDDSQAPAAQQARQMTAALYRHFEAWIRENPQQWMCFSRRWPREAYQD